MKGQIKDKTSLPENTSPVCYQNDPAIQEEYLLPIPKIINLKKTSQAESKSEDQ
ncbi:hypothetical protein [uncultured Cyclobacterium sp.]|uniref:hypothetical protein n=1 Tax=uncultured Cyclobacterium sp. TaxID=453820 RepID=UPI0030EB21FF|tara:strand:- start:288 stop:449 length:162 start_codon:yes stop_codon:yes gene_type:complete